MSDTKTFTVLGAFRLASRPSYYDRKRRRNPTIERSEEMNGKFTGSRRFGIFDGTILTEAGPLPVVLHSITGEALRYDYDSRSLVVKGGVLRDIEAAVAKALKGADAIPEDPAAAIRFLLKRRIGGTSAASTKVRPATEIALHGVVDPVLDFVASEFAEARRVLGNDIVLKFDRDHASTDNVTGWRFRMLALRTRSREIAGRTVHRIDGVGYDQRTPSVRFKLATFHAIQCLVDDAWIIAPTEAGVQRKFAKYVPGERALPPEEPLTQADADDVEAGAYDLI